jgi:hypothetical protein
MHAMDELRQEHRAQIDADEQDHQQRVGEIEAFYENEMLTSKEAHEAAASQSLTNALKEKEKEFEDRLNAVLETKEVQAREVFAKHDAELTRQLSAQRAQHDQAVLDLDGQLRALAGTASAAAAQLEQTEARLRLIKKQVCPMRAVALRAFRQGRDAPRGWPAQSEKDLDELREQLEASRDALATALGVTPAAILGALAAALARPCARL